MINKPAINLQNLAKQQQEPCISMYLPTGAKDGDPSYGKIRLKNMLRKTEERIKEYGIRNGTMTEALKRVHGFADNSTFWRQGGRGMALFMAPETFDYFMLPNEVNELLVVSERFHLKPLVPLIGGNVDFYILKPSQKNPKLYHCTDFGIEEVESVNLPSNMEEALMEEYPGDLSMRSIPRNVVGEGKLVHGHAGKIEGDKERFARYARILDHHLHDFLNKKKKPLLLMGVRYEQDLYRQENTYPHLLAQGIEKLAEKHTLSELHARAIEATRSHYEQQQRDASEVFAEKKASGLASNDIEEIIRAAIGGRVDYIFVGLGHQCWGTYENKQNKVNQHDKEYTGDMDLLDFAASQTLLTGGKVYAVDPEQIPNVQMNCPVAAAFRY